MRLVTSSVRSYLKWGFRPPKDMLDALRFREGRPGLLRSSGLRGGANRLGNHYLLLSAPSHRVLSWSSQHTKYLKNVGFHGHQMSSL